MDRASYRWKTESNVSLEHIRNSSGVEKSENPEETNDSVPTLSFKTAFKKFLSPESPSQNNETDKKNDLGSLEYEISIDSSEFAQDINLLSIKQEQGKKRCHEDVACAYFWEDNNIKPKALQQPKGNRQLHLWSNIEASDSSSQLYDKEPEETRKIFFTSFHQEMGEKELHDYFSYYVGATVEDCILVRDEKTNKYRGYGFFLFESSKGAALALNSLLYEIFFKKLLLFAPKQDGSEPEELCKMLIRNIPFRTGENKLRRYFHSYGKVIDCYIMEENQPSRNGFITFSHADMLYAALADQPHELDDQLLKVKAAIEVEPEYLRKITVKYLNPYTTEIRLYNYFKKYGNVISCVIMREKHSRKSRGLGYVIFENISDVTYVRAATPHIIDGRTVNVMLEEVNLKSEEFRKLYLVNVDSKISEDTIIYYFERFGPVDHCVLKRDKNSLKSRGYGYVMFKNSKDLTTPMAVKRHIIDYRTVFCFQTKTEAREFALRHASSNKTNSGKKPQPKITKSKSKQVKEDFNIPAMQNLTLSDRKKPLCEDPEDSNDSPSAGASAQYSDQETEVWDFNNPYY